MMHPPRLLVVVNMPAIIFEYSRNTSAPSLTVNTGANEISWAYNLNTQTYPTYAGEVVQVLSTNIDLLTIEGEVGSYEKMEQIYRWFLFYIQDATQGVGQSQGFNEDPMTMKYPHRGWSMQIQPISLPGLQYGRDVVVPRWQVQAHILEPDPDQVRLTIDQALPEMSEFGRLTADIGYREQSPYSDPLGILNEEEKKLGIKLPNQRAVSDELDGIAKRLSDNLLKYTENDFSTIMEMFGIETASAPAETTKSDDAEPDQEKDAKPKKKKG